MRTRRASDAGAAGGQAHRVDIGRFVGCAFFEKYSARAALNARATSALSEWKRVGGEYSELLDAFADEAEGRRSKFSPRGVRAPQIEPWIRAASSPPPAALTSAGCSTPSTCGVSLSNGVRADRKRTALRRPCKHGSFQGSDPWPAGASTHRRGRDGRRRRRCLRARSSLAHGCAAALLKRYRYFRLTGVFPSWALSTLFDYHAPVLRAGCLLPRLAAPMLAIGLGCGSVVTHPRLCV